MAAAVEPPSSLEEAAFKVRRPFLGPLPIFSQTLSLIRSIKYIMLLDVIDFPKI